MKTIAAVFHDEQHVRDAYGRLQDAGVAGDDIGLLMRQGLPERRRREEIRHSADEVSGAGVGAAIGGTAGWVAGFGAAGAALTLPVVGPVLAAGAIAGIVSAAGGTLGWLAGGLSAHGMESNEAKFYEQAVEQGDILMTVRTPEANAERARAVLRLAGGQEYAAG